MHAYKGYDVTGIIEMWWDGSHNWNAGIHGYKLQERQGGARGEGAALYVNDQFMELHLGVEEELTYGLGLKGRQGKDTL